MDNQRKLFVIVLLSTNIVSLAFGVHNSSQVPSPNVTWSGDDRILGLHCDSGACLRLCCPPGEVQLTGSCVDDNATSELIYKYEVGKDVRLVIDDPCAYNWMTTSILKDFLILPNGTIYAPDFEDQGSQFCLFQEHKSAPYVVKACRPWIKRVYWQISILIFAIVMMISILVIYSVIPELGNVHGIVFRAYLATYITAHLCAIAQQLSSGSRSYDQLFTFFAFSVRYCGCCCALWLTVMSFNIWRSLRNLRCIESQSRKQDRRKLVWYAIYVFATPAVLIMSSATVIYYVPRFHVYSLDKNLILWSCSGLLVTAVMCNVFFHISTALNVRQYGKDSAGELSQGVNKQHEVHEQWVTLNWKLFVITGCHTLMWVVWELWPTIFFTSLVFVFEGLRSVLLFVIFVWKGTNVKRLLRKRFSDGLMKLVRP